MKVLQICSKPPLPEIDGGCKAMNNISQGLIKSNIELKILTIETQKHPFKEEAYDDIYKSKISIESSFIDTAIKPMAAFFNLLGSKSYNIVRFYSKEFEQLIVSTLRSSNYDVVFLEGLFVTPYIEAIAKENLAKIIYRAHNIESEIWERNASQEKSLIKKGYLQVLAKRLKKHEQSILNKVDGVAAITQKDKDGLVNLGCKKPIIVTPFGIDINKYSERNLNNNLNFFHIGSMDWIPNQEGIRWFLEDVWDSVVENFPEAQLNLAGKGMPDWMLNWRQKNVRILGEVDDAIEFINENDIMIVPLFSGSGMRIKIIEGMALGKTIIATTIAAEGINCTAEKNILIANNTEEYLDSISRCILNKEFSLGIGSEAKKMIQINYDNQLIVNNLVQFFKS
jgi:glycosyltransferase involved in cell wall biosynthesis